MKKSFISSFICAVCFIMLSLMLPITVNALTITPLSYHRELLAYAEWGTDTDDQYDYYNFSGVYNNSITASAVIYIFPTYITQAWGVASQNTTISVTTNSFSASGNLDANRWAMAGGYASASSSVEFSFNVDSLSQYLFTFQDNAYSSVYFELLNLDTSSYMDPFNGTMAAGNYYFHFWVVNSGNSDFTFNVTEPAPTGVPEPGILILLGISMMSVFGLRRWCKA